MFWSGKRAFWMEVAIVFRSARLPVFNYGILKLGTPAQQKKRHAQPIQFQILINLKAFYLFGA